MAVLEDGRVIDFDAASELIGIEALKASSGVHLTDPIERFGLQQVGVHLANAEARFRHVEHA